MPGKRRNHGFTLIELLVVIAIIALLLSIIVPSLKKAKSHAQRVIEHVNLRSLGTAMQLYLNNNDDLFFPYDNNFLWLAELGKLVDNIDEIRYSPRSIAGIPDAVKQFTDNGNSGSYFGSNRMPWLWGNSPEFPVKLYELGSFGLNGWLYSGTYSFIDPSHRSYAFARKTAVRNPSRTPVILNSNWADAWPRNTNALPAWQMSGSEPDSYETGARNSTHGSSTNNFMMGRFLLDAAGRNATNVIFVDNSVATIPLDELWALSWHIGYQPNFNPVMPPRN